MAGGPDADWTSKVEGGLIKDHGPARSQPTEDDTMTAEREIPQERQVELRQLAAEIRRHVSDASAIQHHLPKNPEEARFVLRSLEELANFVQTGSSQPQRVTAS